MILNARSETDLERMDIVDQCSLQQNGNPMAGFVAFVSGKGCHSVSGRQTIPLSLGYAEVIKLSIQDVTTFNTNLR